MRKRLHERSGTPMAGPSLIRRPPRITRGPALGLVVLLAVTITACDSRENPLAPYEGERELQILRVTQSFTSDVQWVGGRVAAVGVNRGTMAALDSTLVWMITSDGDNINSHVTIGTDTDAEAVARYGGTAVDRLSDDTEYTFWIATHDAYAANLDASSRNAFTFVDTTLTMNLVLAGLTRGGADVTTRVVKDESLLGTQYVVEWTPADHAFRRVAIRRGAALPAFTDLIWHIVVPDGEPDSITSPLIIGEEREGTVVAIGWPEGGFEPAVHTLWMVDSTWDNTFGPRARGMSAVVMFATNF
jgi:hypothetical protein